MTIIEHTRQIHAALQMPLPWKLSLVVPVGGKKRDIELQVLHCSPINTAMPPAEGCVTNSMTFCCEIVSALITTRFSSSTAIVLLEESRDPHKHTIFTQTPLYLFSLPTMSSSPVLSSTNGWYDGHLVPCLEVDHLLLVNVLLVHSNYHNLSQW